MAIGPNGHLPIRSHAHVPTCPYARTPHLPLPVPICPWAHMPTCLHVRMPIRTPNACMPMCPHACMPICPMAICPKARMRNIGTRDSHMAGIHVQWHVESLIRTSLLDIEIPLRRMPGVLIIGTWKHGHVGISAQGHGHMGIWGCVHLGIWVREHMKYGQMSIKPYGDMGSLMYKLQ